MKLNNKFCWLYSIFLSILSALPEYYVLDKYYVYIFKWF